MDASEIAQVVAAVLAAQAQAPASTPAAAPAVSAPAVAVIASPFAATRATAARPATIATEAQRLYPQDRHAQRVHVAISRTPGFTCTVDTTATLATGETVESALHGFTTARESGVPCPGVAGLPKGESCPGKIR